jgi:hypothetical protein
VGGRRTGECKFAFRHGSISDRPLAHLKNCKDENDMHTQSNGLGLGLQQLSIRLIAHTSVIPVTPAIRPISLGSLDRIPIPRNRHRCDRGLMP